MSLVEVLLLSTQLLFIVLVLVRNYRKHYLSIFSPSSVYSFFMFYYVIIAPLSIITFGDFVDRGIITKGYFDSAWLISIISYVSLISGYYFASYFKKNKKAISTNNFDIAYLKKAGFFLNGLGFIGGSIAFGGEFINLVTLFISGPAVTQTEFAFSSYFMLMLNFLIVGNLFFLKYYLITQKGFSLLLINVLITFLIYLSIGFRYRILLLFGSFLVLYYVHNRRKIKIRTVTLISILLILGMGFLGMLRSYYSGITLNRIENISVQKVFSRTLGEANVFTTTGAVIEVSNKKNYRVYFEPVYQTIIYPIPSAIYESKNSAGYLNNILSQIYGSKRLAGGAAFMYYGEYYIAFGMLGVIIISFFWGTIFNSLWKWFLRRKNNPFAQITYSVSVIFIYMFVSRGYLPQLVMLFFYTCLPSYLVYYYFNRS